MKVLGVHIDGGMCEYMALPEKLLFPAQGISLDEAAMVEFLAIGNHAVARARISPGQRALVVGMGPIGIGVAVFARLAGAEVTVLECREDRLAFCMRHLGVAHTVKLGPNDLNELSDISNAEFFHHVFDATGSPMAMERGFALTGHGGTYVLVSLVQGMIGFSDPEFHRRETTLLSSRNATLDDFAMVMTAMRGGHIPAAAINTHRASLYDIAERMPEWIRPVGEFDRAFSRLWFDCHITGEREFAFAVEQLGAEHLVLGTNFGGWDRGTTPELGALAEGLTANAVRLLRLERPSEAAIQKPLPFQVRARGHRHAGHRVPSPRKKAGR